MPDDNTAVQTAQVNAIMSQLRPQLPVVAAGGVIADELIKSVQDILIKNHEAIIAGALIAGGLTVLIPALTIAVVNLVGFTAGGVAAGSLAAALQSAIYGGLTTGVFSVLQSIGATAVVASPLVLATAGAAVVAGGGYLAYKEVEKHSAFIMQSTARFADQVVNSDQTKMIAAEAHNHLRAAGEGAGAFFGAVGEHAGFAVNSTAQFAEHVVHSEQTRMIAAEARSHLRAAGEGAGAFFGAAGQHAAFAANSTASFFGGLGRAVGR